MCLLHARRGALSAPFAFRHSPQPDSLFRHFASVTTAHSNLARDWWLRCEELAKLPHQPGCGWHSLRRLFATELKHVNLKDLCELGGWRSPQLVVSVYQRADPVTMRKALEQRGRLKAVGS